MSEEAPPYPAHWEADVVLRDGIPMHIRPIRPEDAPALQELHLRQSPLSQYYRFFAPMERISERDLHRFTHVDHDDRVALVLTSEDRILAVGRYDRRSEEHTSELQSRGHLVCRLLLEKKKTQRLIKRCQRDPGVA